MKFEPWMFAAMEEKRHMTTNEGLINRVANYLSDCPNDVIETDEFRTACISCTVDPDSFSEEDLKNFRQK